MSDKAPQRSLLGWIAVVAPLALFAALALIFLSQLLSGRDKSELPSALIGGPAPVFALPPLPGLVAEGKPVPGLSSEDLTGGLHLVNIFGSWCAPCRAEHPVLMQLARDKRLKIVGVNYKDDPGNALRFLGALGNPYSRVGVDPKGRVAIDWGFYGIPESLLVDADGTVRHKVIGPLTPDKLALLVEQINKYAR